MVELNWKQLNQVLERCQRKEPIKPNDWEIVSKYVLSQSLKQYKRKSAICHPTQLNEFKEAHTDRVVLFIRFLQENPNKSVAFCKKAWIKRFFWFELVREFGHKGISLGVSQSVSQSVTRLTATTVVRKVVLLRKLNRTLTELIGRNPTSEELLSYWACSLKYKPSKKQLATMLDLINSFVLIESVIVAQPFSQLEGRKDSHELWFK